jgi:hypothetical protein
LREGMFRNLSGCAISGIISRVGQDGFPVNSSLIPSQLCMNVPMVLEEASLPMVFTRNIRIITLFTYFMITNGKKRM